MIDGEFNSPYFDRLDSERCTEIKLTSPNGGELWFVDTRYPITWEPDRKAGKVRIDISTTVGDSWWDITKGYYTPNDGQYSYVPNTKNISGHCLFRVVYVDNPDVKDQSDDEFTIIDSSYG